MTFVKNDAEKPDLTLLPYGALSQAAFACMYGAKKYGKDNWKQSDDCNRFIAAALRHLHQRSSGQQYDDETGLDHLAHAAASCLFALELSLTNKEGNKK